MDINRSALPWLADGCLQPIFPNCDANTTAEPSPTATITVNSPPVVVITTPTDGAVLDLGDTITFAGTATDPEDGDISGSIVWASDIDGSLGAGSTINIGLAAGTHQITATATDSDGLSGQDSITVVVVLDASASP